MYDSEIYIHGMSGVLKAHIFIQSRSFLISYYIAMKDSNICYVRLQLYNNRTAFFQGGESVACIDCMKPHLTLCRCNTDTENK